MNLPNGSIWFDKKNMLMGRHEIFEGILNTNNTNAGTKEFTIVLEILKYFVLIRKKTYFCNVVSES